MHYQDKGSSNPDEICNFFADHLKSVYSEFSIQSVDFSYLKLSDFNLSLTDIESTLLSLVENTSIDCHAIVMYSSSIVARTFH